MYGTLDPQYDDNLVFLYYRVPDGPRVEVPVVSDVFNRVQPHWIWDEFDLIEPGLFSHSILISDGRDTTGDQSRRHASCRCGNGHMTESIPRRETPRRMNGATELGKSMPVQRG